MLINNQAPHTQALHNQALLDAGYRSSFTLPIRIEGQLLGFIFFNAVQANDFSKHLIPQLEIAAFASPQ